MALGPWIRHLRWLTAILLLAVPLNSFAADTAPVLNIEMPSGIKIRQTERGPVFATEGGMTIYKKLPKVGTWALAAGQADANGSCAYQCASEWPPVTAPKDSIPVGDFTIVVNEQGVSQWAYKGVRLQTFKYDREPGDTLGDDTFAFNGPRRPFGEAAWIESEVPLAEPPPEPELTKDLPPGVTVQKVYAGNRVFANAEGFTLYSRSDESNSVCDTHCFAGRHALSAASLARSIADWSVVEDEFGVRLWAFKGRRVYTYSGDREARKVEGEVEDWRPVFEYLAPLPAQVAVGVTETGLTFVDKATQRALYYQGFAPRPYEYLGFNHPQYRFGTVNCQNECAKTFPPLVAPAQAEPIGEWWIVTRLDGTKQWAHKGVPVYMYAKDQPGRHLASYRGHEWAVLHAEQ